MPGRFRPARLRRRAAGDGGRERPPAATRGRCRPANPSRQIPLSHRPTWKENEKPMSPTNACVCCARATAMASPNRARDVGSATRGDHVEARRRRAGRAASGNEGVLRRRRDRAGRRHRRRVGGRPAALSARGDSPRARRRRRRDADLPRAHVAVRRESGAPLGEATEGLRTYPLRKRTVTSTSRSNEPRRGRGAHEDSRSSSTGRRRRRWPRSSPTQLGELIRRRRIPAGTRLPSSRTLSEQLGVGRNTVVHAYETLTIEGLVESRAASGFFATPELPSTAPQSVAAARSPATPPRPAFQPRRCGSAPRASTRPAIAASSTSSRADRAPSSFP